MDNRKYLSALPELIAAANDHPVEMTFLATFSCRTVQRRRAVKITSSVVKYRIEVLKYLSAV